MKPRVLVVDDKENIRNLLRDVLGKKCDVSAAEDAQRALALALTGEFDVVISDIRMPGSDGLILLSELKHALPDIEVVLMTAYGSVEKAVEAMKAGAYDYITKPFDPDEALLTVERAAERRQLRREAVNLRAALEATDSFECLAGRSRPMQAVFELLRRAASSDVTVLITGESGTGKELAAKAIHRAGTRRDAEFFVVDCAALHKERLEPEPIWHPKDAYATGEGPTSRELFADAAAGTLLLDGIDGLSPALQVSFARALQEHAERALSGPSEARRAPRLNRHITH